MGRQLAEHPCTFASTFESCSFHVKQSKQSARRRIVKTKVAKKRSVQQSGRLFWRNGFVCGCRRQKAELRFSHAGYSYLLPPKGSYAPRAKTAALLLFAAKKYKSTPRLPQKRRLLKKPPENTQYYLIYGVVRNCIAASRSRGWRVPCRSTCPCANRRGTRRPPCSAG